MSFLYDILYCLLLTLRKGNQEHNRTRGEGSPDVDLQLVGSSGRGTKPSTHRQWKLPWELMQRWAQGYVVVHSSTSTHVFPSCFRRKPGWHRHCRGQARGMSCIHCYMSKKLICISITRSIKYKHTLKPILRSSQSCEQPLSLLLRHSLTKQLFSSEPSPQSFLPSHSNVSFTHLPLVHRKAVSLQRLSMDKNKTTTYHISVLGPMNISVLCVFW